MRARSDAPRVASTTAELAIRLADLVPDPSVPFIGLFTVDLPAAFEVVLGAELTDAPAGTEPIDLPSGPVAGALHHGSVDTVALTWWPLLAWVHERGLEPAGPVRERYLDDRTIQLSVPLRQEEPSC